MAATGKGRCASCVRPGGTVGICIVIEKQYRSHTGVSGCEVSFTRQQLKKHTCMTACHATGTSIGGSDVVVAM
jgi:hypothetical protein